MLFIITKAVTPSEILAVLSFMQETNRPQKDRVRVLILTLEMVTSEEADIAILTLPVTNYPAQAFSIVTLYPVTSIAHPLSVKDSASTSDLAMHCQIVIKDLGAESSGQETKNVGWLKANQRITVDNFDHAYRAVEEGIVFCRLPEHIIKKRNEGKLKFLR